MRDTGFAFAAMNQADTVTIKVSVHWNHGTTKESIMAALTQAYAEAMQRVDEA